MLPNFLVVGAARAGTTSLYYYLKQHPDVFMSPKKEIDFFDIDKNFERGLDWYEKHFEGYAGQKAVGEASPLYMYLEKVPERIAKVIPNVKLIFILRNPVDRAYSHYWYELMLLQEHLTFERALSCESRRIKSSLRAKRRFSYQDRGFYYKQIMLHMKYFSKSQMLFLLADDLQKHPVEVMKQVFDFLGVDSSFARALGIYRKRNIAKVPRSWKLHTVMKVAGSNIKPLIPKTIRARVRWKKLLRVNLRRGRYPPMRPETRQHLIEVFREENEKLSKFLGRDLSAWNS